ncbi:hypothetical protein AB6805_13720 [Chitinophaga sp. RCC_12]|uniref:hypothetical protein n=1 Tax=Chitinophaga sp. RCC_12 TaxID=3239226 RepID=UPI003524CDB9
MPDEISILELKINIGILPDWQVAGKDVFEFLKKHYEFNLFDDISPRDIAKFRKSLFPPVFLLQKSAVQSNGAHPYIAGYIFPRNILEGGANLHQVSLNKYEQMWAFNIVNKTSGRYQDVNSLIIGHSVATLSNPISFSSGFTNTDGITPNERLRILMVDIGQFVLTMYILDNSINKITTDELQSFLQTIQIDV